MLFGSSLKAALVGANTVNGPGPLKVSTRPACFTADTSVVRFFACEAFCTMVLFGYMAAPPTMGSPAANAVPDNSAVERARSASFFIVWFP